ncbi:MAG TPA: hypothetical protein VMU15_19100 [Anaeromyxobacter sp.]|nr:hypothetical protein [Anaeromyxobacter sp.]
MRRARPFRLDAVAPVHRRPLVGAALLLAGLAAAVALGLAFDRKLAERTQLEASLGASAAPRRRPPTPESLQSAAEVATVERELRVPWTRLLAELETAARDTASTVALLSVEPDPAKQEVRITAEVRALPDALAYLRRLQKIEVLRHPMLESHERRKDDPEHPLRIKLSAGWRT